MKYLCTERQALVKVALFAFIFAAWLFPRAAQADWCPKSPTDPSWQTLTLCRGGWKPYFSIGPALSAVSVNFKGGKIGILDQAAALELHGSNLQYVKLTGYVDSAGKRERVNISFWEWAFGVQIRKPQESPDVTLGVYGVPYGIRLNSFAIGVGILYNTIGSMTWKLENFSLIVPLTYQFGI